MAPRSADRDAAPKSGAVKASTTKAKAANYVPPDIVEYHDEDVPYCGMLYNGSIIGDAFKDRPLLNRLDWLHVPLLVSTPLIALYGLWTVPLRWETALWSVIYYFMTGLGITAGEFSNRDVNVDEPASDARASTPCRHGSRASATGPLLCGQPI